LAVVLPVVRQQIADEIYAYAERQTWSLLEHHADIVRNIAARVVRGDP